eukprot:SAG25_NODE_74_length_16997_cov_287.503166_1_plen_22_part_10
MKSRPCSERKWVFACELYRLVT